MTDKTTLDLLGQNIDALFDDPFYSGTSGSSTLVPQTYQVSIDGHPYVITPAKYQRITVPLQREPRDESVEPGEQSLNIAGAWRRSQDNWFLGAAQDTSSNGFLTMGAVITDLGASKCVACYGPYAWFGVSQFNQDDGIWTTTGISSGTGRLFLSEFSHPLLPAYTTDVMASTGVTGTTTSITMLTGVPYFTVTGDGVWGPSGNVVAEGFLETGWVRYGTLEHKILVAGSVRHTPLLTGQSVQLHVVPFAGQHYALAPSNEVGSVGPPEVVSAGNQVGDAFQLIPVLKRGTDKTKGPVLRWWTCRAMIVAVRQDEILCPIIWKDEVKTPIGDGSTLSQTLKAEWQFLKSLEAQGSAFIYQEGDLSYTCYIDQVEMVPGASGGWNDTQSMLQGICIVKMMTVQ